MRLAVLFWFYGEPALCERRLSEIRADNPGVPVFGLYGGSPDAAAEFAARLSPRLDDFYVFPGERDRAWRWRHGDQMIARWHRDRGRYLQWDTLFVWQWDMLVVEPLAVVLAHLEPDALVLSGVRPVREVARWWPWVDPREPAKWNEYRDFLTHLERRYGFRADPYCGLFIVVAFPRCFLDAYAVVREPALGFLEYKIPTYARVFGVPFSERVTFRPWWAADPSTRRATPVARSLNAVGQVVSEEVVRQQLLLAGGRRIFHPYRSLERPGPGGRGGTMD